MDIERERSRGERGRERKMRTKNRLWMSMHVRTGTFLYSLFVQLLKSPFPGLVAEWAFLHGVMFSSRKRKMELTKQTL